MAARFTTIRALRTPTVALSSRIQPLSTSARLSLKESSSQTDVDYERHKQDSLSKQKTGKAHWKPELASDSEEAVKADRSPSTEQDTRKLQEKTKGAAEEASKAGTSVRDNM